MSNFAFGTYRITDQNPQHIQALKVAIESGIELIDTAANYMDGGAERAIAIATQNLSDIQRERVEIVSKFGYIQGSTLQRHKEEPFESVIECSDDCYHSISKSFMLDQLQGSLQRLQREKIDCYLLHNPEYYLYDAITKGVAKEDMLDEMFDRIFDIFVALEEQVQKGTIGSYGISSNSFSKGHNEIDFLPYEDLITLAERASQVAKNSSHHFTTIELPINLLEKDGLQCASWAKKNGIRILSNRPFNAQQEGMMYRLAEYDESSDYYHHLNELLELCDNDALKKLYNLLEQLDINRHKYAWIGDYDAFLYTQILPHIKKTLEHLDEKHLETMLQYIEMFLSEYRKMVAYECSVKTRKQLADILSGSVGRLQDIALNYLLQRESISYIVVGMRKPSYVVDIMALKE